MALTFETRVVSGTDDVEQSASGSMYLNSSDLELVDDGASIGQVVGLRFTAIGIPQGAIITNAYIQFQTDEVSTAATSLQIRGQDADDAATFTSASNNVSSRMTTDTSVAWTPAAWSTVGQAGIAQRTADLSAIVQEIVNRAGWAGSAASDMVFIITGAGGRTAEAFESGAATAPLLHIEYELPNANATPVIDLDSLAGGTGYSGTFAENLGGVAIAGASALITDADDTEMQRLTVALTNARAGDQLTVNVAGLPSGITVDAASMAANVILTGAASISDYQIAVQQVFFNNTSETPDPTPRSINITVSDGVTTSARAVATIAIDRAPDAVGDTTATVLNTAVTTGNVLANDDQGDAPATVIAFDAISTGGGAVVSNGNGTFTYTPLTGFTGTDSFSYTIADGDGDPSTASVAVAVANFQLFTLDKRVATGADDVEQSASGTMSLNSSDLELVDDGGSIGQVVGLRFTAVGIPQGAIITRAYLQFQTDEVSPAAASLLIRGEDTNDAAAFTSTTRNVSLRTTTDASVAWTPAAWNIVGEAGIAQRTPDLAAIVQEIVNRPGWTGSAASDMVFIVTGAGRRTAEAFESGAATAPLLHVEYSATPPPPPLAVSVADGTPSPQVEGATARIGFAINLTTPTTENVVLTYSTANGTAAAGTDFVGVVNAQATIAAGSTSATVFVDLIDDTTAENAEAFTLVLGSARGTTSGALITIADAIGTGNIADNDGTPGVPRVVAIRDTRALGSPDPSALAWVPSSDTLFLSDSEVEETPFSRTNNLFALNLDGTLKPNGSISLLGFTDEPTGLAFDPFSGHMYFSDDDRFSIFRVDPANPTVKLGEFATNSALLRVVDAEDVAVNPTNGHVFITNGTGNSSAGGPLGRAIVETNSTGTQLFATISLPSIIDDPEALAYDAAHDVFFVGGGFSSNIWVVNRAGAIVATLDTLSNYRNPISNTSVAVKDLELAPSSNPNDDPATLSLYVADFGVSHASNANDGRLFEIADPFWFV